MCLMLGSIWNWCLDDLELTTFFFFQGRCPLAEENVMVFAYLGADQDTAHRQVFG